MKFAKYMCGKTTLPKSASTTFALINIVTEILQDLYVCGKAICKIL